MSDFIYLDNNATTPLLPAVAEAMRPYWSECYGNPASAHQAGRRARKALEDARERLAELLDASPDEVLFTSGATEANNLALFGLTGAIPGQILANPTEHPCVLEPLRQLQTRGFTVDWLPVNVEGTVSPDVLKERLQPETRLACVMLANHETGAVQPVAALRQACPPPIAFHCDATQAVGRLPVRFHELGITSLSLSAHKFHGPKGIGALLLRKGAKLRPLLFGGHQQQGHRPGTEPVPLVIGLVAALEHWRRESESRSQTVLQLRERFLHALRSQADPILLNGPEFGGVPHTLNLSFPGCQADLLLMNLDLARIACSTGSACSSGSLLPSPVLQAMGISTERLDSAMRFSLSPILTEAEIDEAAQRIASAVRRLREHSKKS